MDNLPAGDPRPRVRIWNNDGDKLADVRVDHPNAARKWLQANAETGTLATIDYGHIRKAGRVQPDGDLSNLMDEVHAMRWPPGPARDKGEPQ